MSAPLTKVQIATTGRQAAELLEQIDRLMLDAYHATIVGAGVYEIEERLNLFGVEVMLQNLLSVVVEFGPETFYKVLSIRTKFGFLRYMEMGDG